MMIGGATMKAVTKTVESGAWRECAPGELAELAERQARRQSRRALLRGLTATAAGCAVVGTLGILWSRMPPAESQPIACDVVTRLLPDYIAHKLDRQREAQVRQHLAGCAHCTETLNKLQRAARG
jgi:putative zinc finger protein